MRVAERRGCLSRKSASFVQLFAVQILAAVDAYRASEDKGLRLDHALIASDWQHWGALLYPSAREELSEQDVDQAQEGVGLDLKFVAPPSREEVDAIVADILGSGDGVLIGSPFEDK